MLGIPPRRIAGRAGFWLRVVLVVVAVAHRRLGPSSSATTSTTERVLASSRRDGLGWSARPDREGMNGTIGKRRRNAAS
jgi:hypothetical protein